LGEDRPLPTGVVTFLMTDVEGSTRMWEERPEVASVDAGIREFVPV